MRVIAGKARGINLVAPEGLTTRPITDKIKGALFSSWQMKLNGCHFLDLFSGSGSMGIEAISRGAEKTVFVDLGQEQINIIKKNLNACHFKDGYVIYKDDVFHRIEVLKQQNETFDIIYLDPPFTVEEIFLPVMEALSDAKLLAEDGIIVIRSLKQKELPEQIGQLEKYKYKTYGISAVHYYRRVDE